MSNFPTHFTKQGAFCKRIATTQNYFVRQNVQFQLYFPLTHSWKRISPHTLVRIRAYSRIRRHVTFTFVNKQGLTPSKKLTGNYFVTAKFKIFLFLTETGLILSHKALKLDRRPQSSAPMVFCPRGHIVWKVQTLVFAFSSALD